MRTYRWPLCAGVLLALAFYPVYWWPLVFIALAPLFYFAATAKSSREKFIGGSLVGLVGLGPLVYFSLFQIPIIPGAEVFYSVARLSSIPTLVLFGTLFGLLSLLYAKLRGESLILNASIAAVLYVLVEITIFTVFGGYYPDSFSRAIVDFPLALTWSAMAGTLFVSFVVAFISAVIAEILLLKKEKRIRASLVAFVCAALFLVVSFGYQTYLYTQTHYIKELSVSIIQVPRESVLLLPYGKEKDGVFTNKVIEKRIKEAPSSGLLIYPYTPFLGVTYTETVPQNTSYVYMKDAALGNWLSSLVPSTTVAVVWNSTTQGGKIYDEYSFWQNNQKLSYKKRELYRYSDYMPAWTKIFNLENHRYTVSSGGEQAPLYIAGQEMSGLICSELHQDELARQTAKDVGVVIAVGSDAMFPGSIGGAYSLATARYAAASNRVPVIRGNIHGPSALIASDGSIIASLPFGKEETLSGKLPIQEERVPTLYAFVGNFLMYGVMASILLYAIYRKRAVGNFWTSL